MRPSALLLLASFITRSANAFPHFANILRNADDSSKDDTVGIETLHRDYVTAGRILPEHQRLQQARYGSSQRARRAPEPLLDLPLGGGLLNGILQPLSGLLQKLDIPTPQPFGLRKIPGDDPNHQFIKPGPRDVRGLCPTLNTLANHGYISRNGITTFAEVANACQIGFGLGYDVSTLLSAIGLLAGGDILSGKYSIGGLDNRVPNTLGLAPGLDSHGVFEIDTSITRQDTHWGNNANFIHDQWLDYVALSEKHGGQFNFAMQVEDAGIRYDRSRKYNPSFLAGVLWLFVTHVERVFVFALLPNGTEPNNVNYANVAPFFLDERFPDNWYRRATPWTAPQNFGTAFAMYFTDPKELGANVGLGNFVPLGINVSSMTPEDLTCFVVMNLLDLVPSQLQQPALKARPDLFRSFLKGVVWPFFVGDGHFNCPIEEFTGPSQSAGENRGTFSASGSPVGGKYDGIGYIKADGPS